MHTVIIEDSELGPFTNLSYVDACQLAVVLCGMLECTCHVQDDEETIIFTVTPEMMEGIK